MAGLSLRTVTVSFCGKIPYTTATGSSSLCLKVGYINSLSFIGYFAASSCSVILKLCTVFLGESDLQYKQDSRSNTIENYFLKREIP